MNSINTNALLDMLENQTETHLKEAIMVFQNLKEDQLLKPAPDGGWSIAQCLGHLNSYGNYYLPAINKKLKNKSSGFNSHFKSSWLGNYFIQMMESKKKKFKAFKNHIPPKELKAHEVVNEFISQQEELLRIYRESRNTDLNTIRIPISIASFIRLKLGEVLRFIVAHNERHICQAKRHLIN